MNKENETYFYNPYLPEQREEKGERMSIIRATLIICITALLGVLAVTFYHYQQDRFEVISHKEGIFVFDHRSSALNYCTNKDCKLISAEFVLPKLAAMVVQAPMMPSSQSQQLVNPNFGMMSPNQQQNQPAPGMMSQPMASNMRASNNMNSENTPTEFRSNRQSSSQLPNQSQEETYSEEEPNNHNTTSSQTENNDEEEE